MTDTKFTPGPSRKKVSGNIGNAIEGFAGKWKHGDRWSVVCTYQTALPNPADRTASEERENSDANGSLIAAAPDMYEALENAERLLGHLVEEYPGHAKELRIVKAALAKARGES